MIRLATPCIWTTVCTKGKKESIFTVWFACFLNDICIMSGLSVSISACYFFLENSCFYLMSCMTVDLFVSSV